MYKVKVIRHENGYDLQERVNEELKGMTQEIINITISTSDLNGKLFYLVTIFYKND
jgi:hypothetical protein